MLLSKSICYINEVLKSSIFNAIDDGNIKQFGICELVAYGDKKTGGKMPCEIKDGEAIYAGLDDNYTVVSYHRITDMKYIVDAKNSFGDSIGTLINTADVTLYCYLALEKAKIAPHDLVAKLAQILSFVFPKDKLKELEAKSIVIEPKAASLDTEAILKSEYTIQDFEPVGDAYMFAVKYNIILKYNECQNNCTK